jgi:hypothetical protein
MPNRVLPNPTWHGSPGNLLPLYVAFLQRHSDQYGYEQILTKKNAMRIAEAEVEQYKKALQVNANAISEYEGSIKNLQNRLVAFEDTQAISEAYQALVDIPEVIGTRVDATGALVILLRPRPNGIDFGDFEFDFTLVKEDGFESNSLMLVANRLPLVPKLDYGQMRRSATTDNGLTNFTMHRQGAIGTFKSYLTEMRLDEAVKEVLDRFAAMADYTVNQTQSNTDEEPQPAWEGYVFNPVHAVAKRLDANVNGATLLQVRRHEGVLTIRRNERPKAIEHLRTAQNQFRITKAELEKAQRDYDKREARIDTAKAAEELKFITTGIPGVMGIRFNASGVLVIHVRSSHERNGKRYDMGDYELIMEPHPYETLGVIRMSRTRSPHGYDYGATTMYWHGHETHQWFCYGSRSTEMLELFINGNIAQFTNVAVHTMNAINDGHGMYLNEAQLIPVDEVWINRPRRRPRRPALVAA